MILWIVLFILIVPLSYALALKSMKEFVQTPEVDTSLYLIRNKHKFSEALRLILHELQSSNLSIAFERLFKGKRSALVVFGPKKLLEKSVPILDLLELEDYTNVDVNSISAWETGEKPKKLPELKDDEQMWWQLILWGNLYAQIRCILVSQALPGLPKASSNGQLLDSYKKRSFKKEESQKSLNPEEIKEILMF